MLPTSARLLKMLSLLQARRFWSGAELAQKFGITERSVRRDMERLRTLGYPVHATAGVGGGYELGAGKELPPLPLEDDEAVAVAVGLRAAATGPVRGLEEASLRALAKLEKVLPKRLRRRVQTLESVSVRLGRPGPTIDAELLSLLAGACRDSERLAFAYAARDDARSDRHVEPYHLVHTAERWYLLAYDLERQDWRTFRIDRIQPGASTGVRFSPRPLPDPDVAAWVAAQVGARAYPFQARVTLHASAQEVAAKSSALSGRIEPLDAHRCTLLTGAHDVEHMALHLGFLGFDFEVHEPPELVEAVRTQGERWLRAVTGSVAASSGAAAPLRPRARATAPSDTPGSRPGAPRGSRAR